MRYSDTVFVAVFYYEISDRERVEERGGMKECSVLESKKVVEATGARGEQIRVAKYRQ